MDLTSGSQRMGIQGHCRNRRIETGRRSNSAATSSVMGIDVRRFLKQNCFHKPCCGRGCPTPANGRGCSTSGCAYMDEFLHRKGLIVALIRGRACEIQASSSTKLPNMLSAVGRSTLPCRNALEARSLTRAGRVALPHDRWHPIFEGLHQVTSGKRSSPWDYVGSLSRFSSSASHRRAAWASPSLSATWDPTSPKWSAMRP